MSTTCTLSVGQATYQPGVDLRALSLAVPDAQGTYAIPYIQSSPDLQVRVEAYDAALQRIELVLARGAGKIARAELTDAHPATRFAGLDAGEYALVLRAQSQGGHSLFEARCERIGVGTVIAALGDSITEGYYGVGFWRDDLALTADAFPPEAVSHDGRNFPQFAPTTAENLPEVNCMQSWMTDLNNRLTASLGHPVFIANEGWGGHSTADYLARMRTDTSWHERMTLLRPNVWLLHLGVNDERALRQAQAVADDLAAMVDILYERYGAEPANVLIARPCYDYVDGAEPVLRSYIEVVDRLVARRGLSHGPDFFAAYSRDRETYYGEDPVHPNEEGMRLMAHLWHDAIVARLGTRACAAHGEDRP